MAILVIKHNNAMPSAPSAESCIGRPSVLAHLANEHDHGADQQHLAPPAMVARRKAQEGRGWLHSEVKHRMVSALAADRQGSLAKAQAA
jgi:hypothetical protein